ncbi:MAG: hypothetical protein WD052_11705 [Bacteroidales bacterium]
MQNFGFTGKITEMISPADYEGFELGRVIVEHREQEHFTASIQEKRQKSRELGKMYKEVMREKRKEGKHFKR